MMQVVPKWQVDVTLDSGKTTSVWISDNFIENVLRQVAAMSFTANPLVRVCKVAVYEVASPRSSDAVDLHVGGTTE